MYSEVMTVTKCYENVTKLFYKKMQKNKYCIILTIFNKENLLVTSLMTSLCLKLKNCIFYKINDLGLFN